MIKIDQKYSRLVDELSTLISKLNVFINGSEDSVIPTASGPIKSIAGIKKDLNSIKYTQRIIDHRLLSDVISDDYNIEEGCLVRVWGDTPNKNRIYQKKGTELYESISYSEIYDLRDFLPNPWNFISIEKELTEETDLISFSIPNLIEETFSKVINGSFAVTSDVENARGVYSVDFKILVVTVGNEIKTSIVIKDEEFLSVDDDFYNFIFPSIEIRTDTSIHTHKVTVGLTSLSDTQVDQPYQLDFKLYHVDSNMITY